VEVENIMNLVLEELIPPSMLPGFALLESLPS